MPRRVRLHEARLLRHPWYREMVQRRLRAAEEEERAHRRVLGLCVASFLFWTLLGSGIAAWGMHTPRVEYSRVALEAGVLIGFAGIFLTLLLAHDRRK